MPWVLNIILSSEDIPIYLCDGQMHTVMPFSLTVKLVISITGLVTFEFNYRLCYDDWYHHTFFLCLL